MVEGYSCFRQLAVNLITDLYALLLIAWWFAYFPISTVFARSNHLCLNIHPMKPVYIKGFLFNFRSLMFSFPFPSSPCFFFHFLVFFLFSPLLFFPFIIFVVKPSYSCIHSFSFTSCTRTHTHSHTHTITTCSLYIF